MQIVDEVRRIVAKTLNVPLDEVRPETRLDDLGAQSLSVIEIVFELEDRFGITIPMDDGGRGKAARSGKQDAPFETIAEVAAAVKNLVDAKEPS